MTAKISPLYSDHRKGNSYQLKSGPKRRAKIGIEVLQQSTLDFAFTFSGSVGVAMTIPSERLLIDSNLQTAMKKTIQMVKAEEAEHIRAIAKDVGIASIRAMYKWTKDHINSGCGAEIIWLRDRKEIDAAILEAEHLKNLGSVIEQTSEEMEETIEVVGQLVGADINRHTFHLVFEDAEDIRGTMAETIGVEYTVELPKRYSATLRKTTFVNYATEEERSNYHLISLEVA